MEQGQNTQGGSEQSPNVFEHYLQTYQQKFNTDLGFSKRESGSPNNSKNFLFRRICNNQKLGETVFSEYYENDHSQQISLILDKNHDKLKTHNILDDVENLVSPANAYKPQGFQKGEHGISNEKNPLEHQKIEDSLRHSEFNALLDKREKELMKPIRFNVLVIGEAGLGKSTFIDAILCKNFPSNKNIRSATKDIIVLTGKRVEGKINFEMSLIDTPGYGDQRDLQGWYSQIKAFIIEKLHRYKSEFERLKSKSITEKNLYFNEKNVVDDRVHVCLYFFSGPRIKACDLKYMKKFQKYVSIIPILAKGDSFTTKEVKELKAEFTKEISENKIECFDCRASLGENKQKLKEMLEGPFGPCPPFLIISSLEKIEIKANVYTYGRVYNWGTCNIENPLHCDFSLLYNLLVGYFSLELIKQTEFFYLAYFQTLKRKKKVKRDKNIETKFYITFGAVLTIGVMGTLGFIGRKLSYAKR